MDSKQLTVSCVLSARELDGKSVDLIVFPEGVSLSEIEAAEAACPHALIAAAVAENSRMRGFLRYRGEDIISYLKVGDDTRSAGTGNEGQKLPVYEGQDYCIGVLVCMDTSKLIASRTTTRIRNSSARLKVLCIPADARHGDFFSSDTLDPTYEGIHVLYCNNSETYEGSYPGAVRAKSFITSPHRRKRKVQLDEEALGATLPIGADSPAA